jgi:hypothetical protein
MPAMPARLLVVASLLCAACAAPPQPAPDALVATDAQRGVMAVSALGARNVRVLYVRPPSIVLLREVFVPQGEHVTGVHFSGGAGALIVETDLERFALDTRTWRLAQIRQEARDVASTGRARRRG